MLSDDDMGLIQQDADLFYKTKEWLNHEVIELKEILDEQADSSLDSPRFKGFPYYHSMEGKLDCAETLLRRIDQWEKEITE
mgnify:CR=1 FL=1